MKIEIQCMWPFLASLGHTIQKIFRASSLTTFQNKTVWFCFWLTRLQVCVPIWSLYLKPLSHVKCHTVHFCWRKKMYSCKVEHTERSYYFSQNVRLESIFLKNLLTQITYTFIYFFKDTLRYIFRIRFLWCITALADYQFSLKKFQ